MNDKVNQQPEISVVMPTYNGARWLHQAIDSVLSQTYENFELNNFITIFIQLLKLDV